MNELAFFHSSSPDDQNYAIRHNFDLPSGRLPSKTNKIRPCLFKYFHGSDDFPLTCSVCNVYVCNDFSRNTLRTPLVSS